MTERARDREGRSGPGLIRDSADSIEGKSTPPTIEERRRIAAERLVFVYLGSATLAAGRP